MPDLRTAMENWQRSEQARESARRGSEVYGAKLNEDKVRTIRDMRERGESVTAIARTFGVSPACVSNICNYRDWAWVE